MCRLAGIPYVDLIGMILGSAIERMAAERTPRRSAAE
jgi:hypothetical protein